MTDSQHRLNEFDLAHEKESKHVPSDSSSTHTNENRHRRIELARKVAVDDASVHFYSRLSQTWYLMKRYLISVAVGVAFLAISTAVSAPDVLRDGSPAPSIFWNARTEVCLYILYIFFLLQ